MIQKDMNSFAGKVVLIIGGTLNWPGDSDRFYRAPAIFSSQDSLDLGAGGWIRY
jgi:hypothetical protein